ncbi:MAG: GNAT family N-acetyltransferase [Blastocatellia bacterium]
MITTQNNNIHFADLTLSKRLEKTEAISNVEFVETRAKIFPESGACWKNVAGTYAMYDGVSSPLTQTFGLGIFQPITENELIEIEDFYKQFQAPVFHEVSPLVDAETTKLLNQRNYQPIEFTNVMFRPLQTNENILGKHNEKIKIRIIQDDEQDLWANTAAKGWSELIEFADLMLEISQISAKRTNIISFLAELEDKVIATAALSICDGVALLAGASTVPTARKQGAQLALLNARLNYAAKASCDIAMMCALAGSASQKNAERQGFRIAYTRIKWQLIDR